MPDFSTPAEHAFEEPTPDPSATANSASLSNTAIPLYERYEIISTIEEILANGYKTIALQFPDELLAESVLVYRALMKGIQDSGGEKADGVQCYVLGDSTYGSCCPDVLSAMHLPADFLVHYGHACLTPTASLPVRYVFPKRSLDVKAVAEELYSTAFPDGTANPDESLEDGQLPEDRESRGRKGVVVIWDVAYDWIEDEIKTIFTNSPNRPKDLQHVICATINKTRQSSGSSTRAIYQYAPDDGCVQPLHVKSPRLLSRRLFALHSSFSASTYGILVHNVGLARSHGLVKHLRKLLKDKGKKSYTVSVGRVNPAKLANFEVVDCWVLVGCLEGGLVDPKEYYKPILTPWELQLSLQGDRGVWAPDQWTLDFRRVLADLEEEHGKIQEECRTDATNDGEDDSDNETPVYSLVTGELHSVRRFGHRDDKAKENGDTDALILRNQENALAQRHGLESVAANHLAQRQWTGLDPTEGLKGEKWEPSMLEEGRRGIAKGYRVDGIGREG
ncbi:hypothetical protein QFC22_005632 [Naganishia vaughanmartiniae]|uniref:Uncharacterized protein n=1 Tax=Naganishia vaughanmartiniae TaxID=1424756 RepID=A0ACC2WTK6_9TREE|nr:hypothetical protein QFC22_005632 [Naganishia vaughanmartiniae]